jgi:hypothetical protein
MLAPADPEGRVMMEIFFMLVTATFVGMVAWLVLWFCSRSLP